MLKSGRSGIERFIEMIPRWKTMFVGAGAMLSCSAHPGSAREPHVDQVTLATLQTELDALELELVRAEDAAAIRRLQRAYGFFIDKGLWEDLSSLFTDDARASYPVGVFIGKASIREHIWRNVGDGSIGIKDGRVYNHMVIQPVINVAADGKSAKGRWRVLGMIGRLADVASNQPGQAMWAGGIYENVYAKDNGVWKIKELRYYSDFAAPYDGGWANVIPLPSSPSANQANVTSIAPSASADDATATSPKRRRTSWAHPPDQPNDDPCAGYPAPCIQPFHYDNPVSGRANQP